VLANGDFNNAAFASKPKLNRGKATKAKKQAFFSDSEEDFAPSTKAVADTYNYNYSNATNYAQQNWDDQSNQNNNYQYQDQAYAEQSYQSYDYSAQQN
jgi:hypothetical protein